eukprot:SAG31_NODE_33589_length_342_cov_0.748971_1_plen_85_part_10
MEADRDQWGNLDANIDDEVEGVTAGASYAAKVILTHASGQKSTSNLVSAVAKESENIEAAEQREEVKLAEAQLKRLQRDIDTKEE